MINMNPQSIFTVRQHAGAHLHKSGSLWWLLGHAVCGSSPAQEQVTRMTTRSRSMWELPCIKAGHHDDCLVTQYAGAPLRVTMITVQSRSPVPCSVTPRTAARQAPPSMLQLTDITADHYNHCLVTKSCPTLCDPVDCSLPGFSVHGISQERTMEWAAISFFREYSQPKDQSHVSCIGRQILLPLSHQGSPKFFPCSDPLKLKQILYLKSFTSQLIREYNLVFYYKWKKMS